MTSTPKQIVAALREWADAYDDSSIDAQGKHYDTCMKAADLIERMQKVVDAARDFEDYRANKLHKAIEALDKFTGAKK